MLRQRAITGIFIVPVVVGVVYAGGWVYGLFILTILVLAGLEYERMAKALNMSPTRVILLAGVVAIVTALNYQPEVYLAPAITLSIALALGYHLIQYERGDDNASRNWAGTTLGMVYLGLMGGYMLATRNLPNGLWWTLIVLPATMLADTGGYAIGKSMGRHKMAARLSPKKTWEGFIGGVVFSIVITGGLAWLWQNMGENAELITWQHGMIIGLIVAFIGPIGDLGISMLKREANIKDSGTLLAGMGGMLDRIDSWLLASAAGYFYIIWVALPQ